MTDKLLNDLSKYLSFILRHEPHEETARKVGQRHGKAVVLNIEALLMSQRGFKFYKADNGVWLTDHVPSDFLVSHTV